MIGGVVGAGPYLGDRAVGVADLAEAAGLAPHRFVDEATDLGAVDGLVLEQRLGDGVEPGPVLLDDACGPASSSSRRMRSTSSSMTRAVSSE